MLVRCILPSTCLSFSMISHLCFMQYIELHVINFPFIFWWLWEYVYFIFSSSSNQKMWRIRQCLGFGHETMARVIWSTIFFRFNVSWYCSPLPWTISIISSLKSQLDAHLTIHVSVVLLVLSNLHLTNGLSHWGRVTHICVSKLGHHWFRQCLVAGSTPSHCLNKC